MEFDHGLEWALWERIGTAEDEAPLNWLPPLPSFSGAQYWVISAQPTTHNCRQLSFQVHVSKTQAKIASAPIENDETWTHVIHTGQIKESWI